jgi:hypothetical protein
LRTGSVRNEFRPIAKLNPARAPLRLVQHL